MVPSVHCPDLRNGDMRFVNDHQEIIREIVYQAKWADTCLSAVKITGIIFYAGAESQFANHL